MAKWLKTAKAKTRGREPEDSAHAGVSCESDEVLIQRIVERDQQALEIIYHRYYKGLYQFISRITGHYGSAEEAINDVMYVVWNKAATFRTGTKLSTWIFGIACNKALKSLARDKKFQDPKYREALDEDRIFDPDARYQRLETENWLLTAMAQLSQQHRTTVELTYYFGMSYREVAEVMNCNENTVKTRMFHARKKLRAILPTLASCSDSKGV